MNAAVDKVPQYQMLFTDKQRLADAVRLVIYQLATHYSDPDRKRRMCLTFKHFVEAFFAFEFEDDESESLWELDTFSEDDVKLLMSEKFMAKRLENVDLALEDLLKRETAAKVPSSDKWATKRPVKRLVRAGGTRSSCGLFAFETVKDTDRFVPRYRPESANVLYGGPQFYCLFRHLHCLYERLVNAHTFAGSSLDQELERRTEIKVRFKEVFAKNTGKLKEERYDQIFLVGVNSYLTGDIDSSKYEDLCKCYLGPKAYLLFTVDKLLTSVPILLIPHVR